MKVKSDGLLGALEGRFSEVSITARDFSVNGLPLFSEPERSKYGRIKSLKLRLFDFSLRGLRIEELKADLRDCRFDFALALDERKVRLSRSGSGEGYVRVNEKALEDFILRKYHEIKRIRVELKKYKVYVEGYGEFPFFKTEFYVIADLVPKNDFEIHLENAFVFLGRSIDETMKRALLDFINPVIHENEDLALYGALKMKRVEIGEGVLELFGEARIPERPNL
ncbi:MAG TPA: hypothetical protein VNK96_00375 [Fimbriimonadales bacterium]|nr:hypothetical protein [Fimbriimonadales bacterium]